jgi:transcriptional regulator with XRE-family HTH domain
MSQKLHEVLRDRRIALGWSQWVLAQKMDKSQNTIWQWESGKVDPRAYSLQLWAATLGMKVQAVVDPDVTPV